MLWNYRHKRCRFIAADPRRATRGSGTQRRKRKVYSPECLGNGNFLWRSRGDDVIVRAFFIACLVGLWGATSVQGEDWKLPASCPTVGTWGEECTHGNGGFDQIAGDKTQWMEVTTDSALPIT